MMSDSKDRGEKSTLQPQPVVEQRRTSAQTSGVDGRWWRQLIVGPLLILAAGVVLIVGLGVAQRCGWLRAGGDSAAATASNEDSRQYICPMLCTAPQIGPGRCPVCEMELVPAASGGGASDRKSVEIDSVARRVADIETVAAKIMPLNREIRAVGELHYDEGALKTISAYVDGRLDRLYADFTGAVVEKGDHLALVYSPRLYSAQVEFLLAKKSRDESRNATLARVQQTNKQLYRSARQRLIELGMTEEQIKQLESAGEASSRLHMCAPISGTVIKKYATEGQYLKEGQAIYKLADLSTVWLMLELFPDDAAAIRYGQQVEAEMQSLPGRRFTGRVAFVDPVVNAEKRTVGVRVVIPNEGGLLRVGDFAKASIETPIGTRSSSVAIYDPQLAGKWIGPRHPHVVEDAPGKCRVCGVDLAPAVELGFTDDPSAASEALAVPRSAVLAAGDDAVVYVETKPGRFEIRNVVIGQRSGDYVVVLDGLAEGEQVAVSGNFLIDSQMQLAGNASLIDPNKATPSVEYELDEDDMPPIAAPMMIAADGPSVAPDRTIAGGVTETKGSMIDLSLADARLAAEQGVCPVTGLELGSMGPPIKAMIEGKPVFICCEGCRQPLVADPAKYLAKLESVANDKESNR